MDTEEDTGERCGAAPTTRSGAASVAETLGRLRIIDLAQPLRNGIPQSPNHPQFLHVVPRRHGDVVRPDGGSGASDLLITGTHVGTHIDALAHISQNGLLHDGLPSGSTEQGDNAHDRLGAHTIPPIFSRGILLDLPSVLGVEACAPGFEIKATTLRVAEDAAGVRIGVGDVILVRTGWGRYWDDPHTYVGKDSGLPGVGSDGARWLAQRRPLAVGSDTLAFEWLAPGQGLKLLPVHRILIVEAGTYIIEGLNLEDLAQSGVSEFLFVLLPLPIVGGTGSPVRPVALAEV